MMLSRKFTTRERVLLLILAVILLAELYYLLVHQRVEREFAEAQARTETATVSYEFESARAERKREMQEKNEKARKENARPLPEYDNSTNVVAYLNGVMAATGEYNLVFNTVNFSEYAAVRPINMSFSCPGYSAVKDIVAQLENGPYYCEVTGLSMSTERGIGDMTGEMVSVQMTAVFYEYAGARAQAGDKAP